MPIPLIDVLSRQNDGNFPLLINTDAFGGWMTVADNTARDAIISAVRTEGMHVFSVAAATLYRLDADLVTWVAVPFGSGVGISAGNYLLLNGQPNGIATTPADNTQVPLANVIAQRNIVINGSNRIELSAGISYSLEGVLRTQTTGSTNVIYQFYDVTNAAYIGTEAQQTIVTSASAVSSSDIARAMITPLVDIEVELRVTSGGGVGDYLRQRSQIAVQTIGSSVWGDDGTNITPLNEPRALRMSSGGNARGAQAVDLQQTRAAATQVASGADSFMAGSNNTASASTAAAVGGSSNVASGTRAAAVGGFGNQATATNAATVGGTANTAGADNSVAQGNAAVTAWRAEMAHANEEFSTPGDAQVRRAIVRRNDVDSSGAAVTLTLDGTGVPAAGNTLVVPDATTWLIEAHVAFVDNDLGNLGIWDQCGFVLRAVAYNNTAVAANVTLGTVEIDKLSGDPSSTATLVANVATGSIDVQCTPGKADVGRVYHYIAHVMITQIANIPTP